MFGPLVLAYMAFIVLGMPDGLLGIAWPTMQTDFGVQLDSVGVLVIAGISGYMVSSFFSGALMARLGVGNLLAISCALTGIALYGFTVAPVWWMIVLLDVVAGLGAGAIDASLNTYAAAYFSEGLVQWLHASYGIGITVGPLILTISLTTFDTWRVGYSIVAGVQLLMALAFLLTLSSWPKPEESLDEGEREKRLTDYNTPMRETLRQPKVWLSVLLFFLCVGAEVSLGTWAYSLLTESRGVPTQTAGIWAGSFWATFTIGRLLAGMYAWRLGVDILVQGGVGLALLGAVLLWWNPSQAADLLAIALLGLSIAPIYPALISGTSRRVGAHLAANTIGMQVAITGLGAGLIPSLMGVLARRYSLEVIPVCLALIFLALFVAYRFAMPSTVQKEIEPSG